MKRPLLIALGLLMSAGCIPHRKSRGADLLNRSCWAVGVVANPSHKCWSLGDGWKPVGKRMFLDGTKALSEARDPALPLPSGLNHFCLYEWIGKEKPTELSGTAKGEFDASIDCPSVSPQAPSGTIAATAADNERLMLEHAGYPIGASAAGSGPVVIAVVDSGSDKGNPSTDDHGGQVREIVKAASCSGLNCNVSVIRTLGLPITKRGQVRDPSGGDYGTRAHVAVGIVEAVETWRRRLSPGKTPPRLVINLSVGWLADPRDSSGSFSEEQPWSGSGSADSLFSFLSKPSETFKGRTAVAAVNAALVYASCQGALIVASAGNHNAGSFNDHLVAPAAWSRYRGPTESECMDLGFIADGERPFTLPDDDTQAGPLVLPVAAIGQSDAPIVATRPGTLTRLLAPGYYGMGGGAGVPMTGTSVSAALVSAASGLVWSNEPALTPRQVAERLTTRGVPTNLTPELRQFRSPPGESSRLCIRAALNPTGPAPASVCPPIGYSGVTPVPATVIVSPDSTPELAYPVLPPSPRAPVNDYVERVKLPPPSATYGADDLAGPQPSTPICIDCPIKETGSTTTATLELHEDYQASANVSLIAGVLNVWEGLAVTSYDLAQMIDISSTGDLALGERVRVDDIPAHPNLSAAEVEFHVYDGQDYYWRSSQLRVLP